VIPVTVPPLQAEPKVATQKAFEVSHAGKAGQAGVLVVWPTEGYYSNLKRSRGLRLLGEVMTLRLNSILREKEGLAYSPYAYWTGSSLYDQGFIRALAGINPEQEGRFFTTLNLITDDLKNQPISADELLRARKPLMESRRADEKGNDFWLNLVSAADFEPKTINVYKDYEAQMLSYSPQDLQILAQTYLAADRAVTIIARPGPVAPKPQASAAKP
jgi:zinc protease